MHAALDIVEDPRLADLQLEGNDDVIDFQTFSIDGSAQQIAQVKSRLAPPWWTPGELLEVFFRWTALPNSENASFIFISDGAPGPEVHTKLLPGLARLRDAELNAKDEEYFETKGLTNHFEILKRCEFRLSEPSVSAALDQVELRITRLLSGRVAVDEGIAAATVDRLFREIAIGSGSGNLFSRTFSRTEIASFLGVRIDDIDNTDAWDQSAASALRDSVCNEQIGEALIALGIQEEEAGVASLSLVEPKSRSSVDEPTGRLDDLLQEREGAVLFGETGCGKSTSLSMVARMAAAGGALPVLLAFGDYAAKSLGRLVHYRLEELTRRILTADAFSSWATSTDALLLVDGLTERPFDEINSILADVADFRRLFPAVRVVLSGRSGSVLHRVGLPLYLLQSLTDDQQNEIAVELLGIEGTGTAHQLRQALGDAARNPLMFRMGASVMGGESEVTNTAELYAAFVAGIEARATAIMDSALIPALQIASSRLVADARFSANRYWWESTLHEATGTLRARGICENEISGQLALRSLLTAGYLVEGRSGLGDVRLLHDSFRDYFAYAAIAHELLELPEQLDERFEQVTNFLVANCEPSVDLVTRLCDNAVAASSACTIDPVPPGADPVALAEVLLARLLTGFALGGLASAEFHLHAWTSATRMYVMMLRGPGESQHCDEVAGFEAKLDEASLTISLDPSAGPLLISVTLWQELLRSRLRSFGESEIPIPIPNEPVELASAIERHFAATRTRTIELAQSICSSLAHRLVAVTDQRGIMGAVAEQETEDHFSGTRIHSFSYSLDSNEIVVGVSDGASREFQSQTIAEWYLREGPGEAAVTAVEKALGKLLPTWGP